MLRSETIVVRLTPPGKSAIACLGIAGPRAWDAVRAHFRRRNDALLPEIPTTRQTLFGRFGDLTVGSDEVIIFIRQMEPTPIVEIHCHGGPEVIKLIEGILAKHGVETALLDRWLAVIHGAEKAAMIDILVRCTTARTAAIALDQLDRVFDPRTADIARLAELITVGQHLATPWKVALAGAP